MLAGRSTKFNDGRVYDSVKLAIQLKLNVLHYNAGHNMWPKALKILDTPAMRIQYANESIKSKGGSFISDTFLVTCCNNMHMVAFQNSSFGMAVYL